MRMIETVGPRKPHSNWDQRAMHNIQAILFSRNVPFFQIDFGGPEYREMEERRMRCDDPYVCVWTAFYGNERELRRGLFANRADIPSDICWENGFPHNRYLAELVRAAIDWRKKDGLPSGT